MITTFKQWFYPKEFRIKGSGVPADGFSIGNDLKIIEDLISKDLQPENKVDIKFLKEIAVSVWRCERRLKDLPEDLSSHKFIKRVKRSLNMAMDVLKEQKIEIEDFSGKTWGPPYDEMSWGNEPRGFKDGIIIMEEPRLYLNGKLLQKGKIAIMERS